MPSPKSGSAGSAVTPTDPDQAQEADMAQVGGVSQVSAQPRQTSAGQYGTAQAGQRQAPGGGAGEQQEQEQPAPTIRARWSKPRVTPVHNKNWPPSSPPTDAIPDEAKVEMIVDTTNVPDGTSASITVCQCLFECAIPQGQVNGLQVQGNRVIDPATGQRPVFSFTFDNWIYAPWDMDLYYFEATVNYQGLEAETEKNSEAHERDCLRVMWWHMCVSDSVADSPAGGGLTTGAEAREIKGIIDGKRHHKAGRQAFNQNNVPVNLWGSVLRNTYCYHHASHGDIVDRTTGAQLNAGNANPPPGPVGNWRSVIVLGNTNLGDAEVSQAAAVPSVPKYLVYLDTCVAGWEPSFANAWISRGTQNVIAFRMYIPDGAARSMARRFHRKWIRTHNGDPNKINEVFFDVGARYYNSMRPVLFGYAGGRIVPGGRDPNRLEGEIAQLLELPW